MRRTCRLNATALLAFAFLPTVPVALSGQSFVVSVSYADDGQPATGALVTLRADGFLVQALADANGIALFREFAGGDFTVRVETIGAHAVERDGNVGPGDTEHSLRISLERRPLQLEGLDVDTGQRCEATTAPGTALSDLWSDARTALSITRFTEQQGFYRYSTHVYERDLDLRGRVVRRDTLSIRSGVMSVPFYSRPADELADSGYVRTAPGETWFYAPDADVLLSDTFLEGHCMGLRGPDARPQTERHVGLSFRPIERRGSLVDVEGTLWLDAVTRELRWFEFRYTNLDPEIAHNQVGGRVNLRRMPIGTWIISEWWIRMPNMARQRDSEGRSRRYVAGTRQTGGVVEDVQARFGGADGSLAGEITGVTIDSLGYLQAGAFVRLRDTGRETVSDRDGRFRFSGIAPGAYTLSTTTGDLSALGHAGELTTAVVGQGESTAVDVHLPSQSALLADGCNALLGASYSARGVIAGWVREQGSGNGVPGVEVSANWPHFDAPLIGSARGLPGVTISDDRAVAVQVVTDDSGSYRICGVPEGVQVTVRAHESGALLRSEELLSVPALRGVVTHTFSVPGMAGDRGRESGLVLYLASDTGEQALAASPKVKVGDRIGALLALEGRRRFAEVRGFDVLLTGPAPSTRDGRQTLTESSVPLEPSLLVGNGIEAEIRWTFTVTEDMARLGGPFELRLHVPEVGAVGRIRFSAVY